MEKDEDVDIIDLTIEKTEIESDKNGGYIEAEYDPRPKEDTARVAIALILVILLSIILLASLAIVAFVPQKVCDIENYLQLILSPLVALVSAATGFYFGSKK